MATKPWIAWKMPSMISMMPAKATRRLQPVCLGLRGDGRPQRPVVAGRVQRGLGFGADGLCHRLLRRDGIRNADGPQKRQRVGAQTVRDPSGVVVVAATHAVAEY